MTTLHINGQDQTVTAAADTPLLWVLRADLGLTGTKFGCGMALCGACTVHVDGAATRSCVLPIAALSGRPVRTIESLAADAADAVAQAVLRAWVDGDVAQCGYCQPGQVMAAIALLRTNPKPTEAQIEEAMSGNVCRCGTYPRIRTAVQAAARRLGGGAAA
jgi:isoquinoline 1-oxidoreductase subunit alpha